MTRFFSIFGAVLQEFLFQVVVLLFYKTKQFVVFRNLWVISMWFAVSYVICVVFIFNSVQFRSIGTHVMPPSIDCKQSLFCSKICE